MQMMKTLITIWLLCLTTTIDAGEALKASFLSKTGFKDSYVLELLEGPESCQQGRLRIIEPENNQLTLMLGAKPLATAIGLPEAKGEERGCADKQKAVVSQGQLEWSSKTTCSTGSEAIRGMTTRSVVVTSSKEGLSYTRKVAHNGKSVLSEVCVYKYVQGSQKDTSED
jgi:hypothetical protein